jgi:small-conductance mechanosensitive channel
MREGIAAVRTTPDVLQTPAAFVQVADITRDEIRLQFFGWVDQRSGNFGAARSESLRRCRARLREIGIDFGPPTMRLIESDTPAGTTPGDQRDVRVEGDARTATSAQESHEAVADAVERTRVEMGSTDLLKETAPRE